MTSYLFVDGNYLFHITKASGKRQDFDLLEKNLCDTLSLEGFNGKYFYTRPPEATDPKAVVSWLRARNWTVQTFPYQYTHQDSIYVNLVADLWDCWAKDPNARLIIVSGSGALTYPLKNFPGNITVFSTESTMNRKLSEYLGLGEYGNLTEVI